MPGTSPTDPGVRLSRTGLLSEVKRAQSSGLCGPCALDTQAHRFSDMLIPALSPEHALLLAFPPTGRLPSTLSAADLWSVLFEAS